MAKEAAKPGSDEEGLKGLIEGGSELAGAAVGAGLGLLGTPAAALGGATAGVLVTRALKRVGSDLRQRLLGPREEVRVGAAAAYAAATISQLLKAGQTPREDGFFEEKDGERPAAEEIFEGVLLRARDAYEEKKVRFLGILFAHVAFLDEISPANANHLIAVASQLTYRQLVVMAVAQDESKRRELRQGDYRDKPEDLKQLGLDGRALLTEIYDLYQQGLISSGHAWISVADVDPGAMRLQGSGAVLAQVMGLQAIPDEDRAEVYRLLSP